ncbi:Ger(x)C family spore germination protein [Paenibacillus psychroresistens]|uniref:Ger(X)C family spore germination protein n=1 Tax=Paenibacillus psychroresistens TaxID=1778678 RepID=A0A6B8RKG7_9BACL|nr:Ger(x)C family spore germination protein [Paenibacillus psychroresistens]QGQ96085.1 Ger(x)C family spore germination protein [Paenibacillus psychroresistens]
MKFSKYIRLFLSIVILTAFTGCWDYIEFESMALVSAIGIDLDKKGEFLLSCEIIRTQKQGKEGKKSKDVVQGTGKTVPEALANLQTLVPEELFLGYTSAIILSEDAAKQQLKNIMDYLFITPSIRDSVFLVITKENAEKILNMPLGKTGLLVGESLLEFFKVTNRIGASIPVRLREFNKLLLTEGVEPIAPLIKINREGKLMVSDMVVFKGYKLVGMLDGNESKGLGRITNKKIQEISSVSISVPDIGASVSAVFRLKDGKSNIKIKMGDEAPDVFITTSVNATMLQFGGNTGAITQEILRACEKDLEGNVKKELEAAIAKAQKEVKSDFLGIGLKFYQQHRKEWKVKFKPKWREVFPEVPIHVNVKIKILNSGTKVIPLSEQ